MKQIIRKAFWDYEKEEIWLNEMAAKGLALTDYAWCRYSFEQTQMGEYTYRIELLKYPPSHPESAAYLRFLEENGIECVAVWMRWVYLRKKATDGAFELYTDLASKLAHYRLIWGLWATLMGVEFAAGAVNVLAAVLRLAIERGHLDDAVINLALGISLLALGSLFAAAARPLRRRIHALIREKAIRE